MQKVIDRIVAVAATASFVVMILVVLLQIVSRYLFPISIHWTEEAARFAFLYTVAFAAGLATRDKSYVNVDLIPLILRGRARVVLEAILEGATIVFLWVVAWHSLRLVRIGALQTSASLRVPMSWIFLVTTIIPLSMSYYAIRDLIGMVRSATIAPVAGERRIGRAGPGVEGPDGDTVESGDRR